MEQDRVQQVRFEGETHQITTVVINGVECLRLQDVGLRFPTVTGLCIGTRQLAFIADENGYNLEPLRVRAHPDEIMDGMTLKTSAEAVGLREQLTQIQFVLNLTYENTLRILAEMKNLMVQMYELTEYTTPRYFFILPAKHHDWTAINAIHNWFHLHYKLYFLCECSDDPRELHIAPHNGYSIKKLSEFIVRYGPYLQKTLTVLKLLLIVGKFVVPQLAHVSTVIGEALPEADAFGNIQDKIELMENFIEDPKKKLAHAGSSLIRKPSSAPLQGADLRELESYLERIDSTRALGNLYRTVTSDGHVRWVCQQHYDQIQYKNHMLIYIQQFEAMGGKFNLVTKEATVSELKFTGTSVKGISEALKKGFTVSTLIVHHCSISEGHFDALMDIIINRPSMLSFEIVNLTILSDDMINYFKKIKYTCNYLKISFSNHLLSVNFNESLQEGNKNLCMRILMENKIFQTLEISACDFFKCEQQQLQQLLNKNTKFSELIVNYANNVEILDTIFKSKANHLQRLKLNHSLILPSVAKHFCQLLSTNETLVELDLIDSIDSRDKGFLENLFQIIKRHKSIKQLQLHISSIDDSNEKESLLIDFLQNCRFLTHLRLSKSTISSKLIQNVIETIKKHYILTRLEFYLCHLSQTDIEQLRTLENEGFLYNFVVSQQPHHVLKSIPDQTSSDRFRLKSNLMWKQDARTVAGGVRKGDKLNQLLCPQGIYVDVQQHFVYIVDCNNHRIVQWKLGESSGQIVAGGNGEGNRIDQLSGPTDVIVDQSKKSLIICDNGNRRVVRWSLENEQDREIVIENVDCYAAIMNDNEDLFVSDLKKHEVKRWRKGDREGTVVAGGHGSGDKLNQLSYPTFIFIDRQGTVYVSDSENHRVMKWPKGAKEGMVVAGGQGQGNSLQQLSSPRGLIVNEVGDIYVADSKNNRIVCWLSGSNQGHRVLGGHGHGDASNQFRSPRGLSFGVENELYVVDRDNNRVQRFDVDKE